MNQKALSKSLAFDTETSVTLLDNKKAWDRERSICKDFLNALRIRASQNDLFKTKTEFSNVMYRGAFFEVCMILDEKHKLSLQNKEVFSLEKDFYRQLVLPYIIQPERALNLIKPVLMEKKEKYERRNINPADVDVLAYFNLNGYVLDLRTPFPDFSELEDQGWRSLSLSSNTYNHVLFAKNKAPIFLQRYTGRTMVRPNGS